MQFSLSQIVDGILHEQKSSSAIKLAQEEGGETKACEKCGKPAMPNSNLCKECAEKEAKKEEGPSEGGPEKTSSARVEKLASAVEYIVSNFPTGSAGRVKVGQSIDQALPTVGAGKGPNVLDTNVDKPTPGEQSTVSGEAKTKIEMKPAMEQGTPQVKAPPNAMPDNIDTMKAPYPEGGVLKQSSVRERFIRAINKIGADAENPAVLQSSTSTALPEDQPDKVKAPAEVTGQEKLIASNQAAIDATKREAKAVPKKRIGEVLDEPAQTRSTDKVLDENLGKDVVNAAGAKIAAARTFLDKVASEGCTCGGSGTCGFCKIASKMRSKKGSIDGSGVRADGGSPGTEIQ